MMNHLECMPVFGATAVIGIQFDGTLDQLAAILAEALNLKSFTVEASEDVPHKRVGSAEAMGWEAWLEEESVALTHKFRLRLETEHSLKESFEGRMFDLSPWLARLISTVCGVIAQPIEPELLQ